MMRIFSLFLACFFFGQAAVAADRNHGDIEVNLWGVSKHLEDPPLGRQWYETNPGIGLRWFFNSPIEVKSLETFLTADILHNSTGGRLISGGVGAQYPVTSIGDAKLLVGGAVGISSYENRWTGRTYTGPAGYPFVAVRYKAITATIGYIPKIRFRDGIETYPVTFVFVSIPIGK